MAPHQVTEEEIRRVAPRFEGQVVIVTGAAQGLGLATAELLADLGATTVMADINGERLSEVAQAVTERGGTCADFAADLSSESDVEALVGHVLERFSRIDALVHLAAPRWRMPIAETPLEDWHKVVGGTLDSTFLLSRAVLPAMRQAGYGRIVNTASATVFMAPVNHAMYITAKMGVIGFTRVLAREAGADGITANVIMPGAIKTENSPDAIRPGAQPSVPGVEQHLTIDRVIDMQAVKRPGEPADIAHAIAFLISPEAGFITGQTINVDGGSNFT